MTKPDEVLGLDPEFFASRLKKRTEAKTHCRVTAFGPSNEKGGPQAARVNSAADRPMSRSVTMPIAGMGSVPPGCREPEFCRFKGRPRWGGCCWRFWRLFASLPHGVFYVTRNVVSRTFGFVDLTFGL